MKRLWRILKKTLIVFVALALVLIVIGLVWYYTNRIVIPEFAVGEADSVVAPELNPEALEKVRQLISQLRRDEMHPAVSVSVARGGKLLWSEAQGYADLESKQPATIETQFPIGSVSKPLSAVGTMKLVEQGSLDLDADVRKYVPDFPQKAHTMTVRQLLSHQAGIRHYRLAWDPPLFTEMGKDIQYDSVTESLENFANDPLEFPPDSEFQYSTYGYTLLSAAVEKAAGKPFLDYMQVSVFEPLEMRHTQADDQSRRPATRATDYIATFDSSVLPAPSTNSSNKWAGAGFLSTPNDLVQFGVAMLDDKIVSATSRELMFQPCKTLDGKPNEQNYGLGWRIGNLQFPQGSDEYVQFIHHGGTSVGAQSVLLLIPESEVVVAICANSHTGGSGDLLQAAASIARNIMALPFSPVAGIDDPLNETNEPN